MIKKYSQLKQSDYGQDILKTDLNALFKELNQKYFNNKVPVVPVTWKKLTKVYGQASATTLITPLGHVKEINLVGIAISNQFRFTPEMLERILAHEMVHILLFSGDIRTKYELNAQAGHGTPFKTEVMKLRNLGLDVPLSEDIEELIPSNKERIPASVMLLTQRTEDKYSLSKLNKKYWPEVKPDNMGFFFDFFRKYGWGNNEVFVGLSSDPLSQGYPVARDIKNLSSFSIPEKEFMQLTDTLENKITFSPQQRTAKISMVL